MAIFNSKLLNYQRVMYLRVNLFDQDLTSRRDLTGIIVRGIIPFYVLQVSKLIMIYSDIYYPVCCCLLGIVIVYWG